MAQNPLQMANQQPPQQPSLWDNISRAIGKVYGDMTTPGAGWQNIVNNTQNLIGQGQNYLNSEGNWLKQEANYNSPLNQQYRADTQKAAQIMQQRATGQQVAPQNQQWYQGYQQKQLAPFIGGLAGGPVQDMAAPVFKGFEDLSSKGLNQLVGKTTVNPQFIQGILKQPGIKQAEKDILLNTLKTYNNAVKIPVQDFANKVRGNLLELSRDPVGSPRWDSINLPDELQGNTTNYSENIYNSPIQTEAGNVHFGDKNAPGYFAHTRTEDVAPNWQQDYEKSPYSLNQSFNNGNMNYQVTNYNTGEDVLSTPSKEEALNKLSELGSLPPSPETRRVLELQSDLFQRGRLDNELANYGDNASYLPPDQQQEFSKITNRITDITNAQNADQYTGELKDLTNKRNDLIAQMQKAKEDYLTNRTPQVNQLKTYQNNWHERVIKQELQQAAKDGIKHLQFPTGDTAARIEGYLGDGGPFIPQEASEGHEFEYGGEPWTVTRDYGNDVEAYPSSAITNKFNFYDAQSEDIDNKLSDLEYSPADFEYDVAYHLRNSSHYNAETQSAISSFLKKYHSDTSPTADRDPKDVESYNKDIKKINDKTGGALFENIARDMVDQQYGNADEFAKYYRDDVGIPTVHLGNNQIATLDEGAYPESFNKGTVNEEQDIRDQLSPDQQRVYDFYDRDIAKFLRNKYGASPITDENGVSWNQVNVTPNMGKIPIEAYGLIPPVAIGAGGALGAYKKQQQQKNKKN